MPTATITPTYDALVSRNGSDWDDACTGNGTTVDNTGPVTLEQAVYSGNFVVGRLYTTWDVSSIPSNATVTASEIRYYQYAARGTQTGVDVFKLYKSSNPDGDALDAADLYQTITSVSSNTSTTNGATSEYKVYTVDGDLLTYLQEQIAAGNNFATLLRASTDYDNASVSDPSMVNYRAFRLDNEPNNPLLYVTYTLPSTGEVPTVTIGQGVVTLKAGKMVIK